MASISITLDTRSGSYRQRERFKGTDDLQELLAFQLYVSPALAALETSLRLWRESRRRAQASEGGHDV